MLGEENVGAWRRERGCYPLGKSTVGHAKGKLDCVMRPLGGQTVALQGSVIATSDCTQGQYAGTLPLSFWKEAYIHLRNYEDLL